MQATACTQHMHLDRPQQARKRAWVTPEPDPPGAKGAGHLAGVGALRGFWEVWATCTRRVLRFLHPKGAGARAFKTYGRPALDGRRGHFARWRPKGAP